MSTSTTEVAQRVGVLAAARQPGFTLAQPFYTDAGIFEHDLERVFFRHWIMLGHISRLPTAGSYFLYDIGNEQFIVTRDAHDDVHVLWNVCRHRGSRVCISEEGRGNSFACPYHAWTYAPDGRLLGAPAMGEDFNRDNYGLKHCAVHVAHGIIFAYLGSDTPPNLTPVLDDLDPFIRPYHPGEAKLGARIVWEIKANWKLVIENFAECYHCGPAHPEYCSVMEHALADGTLMPARVAAYEKGKAEWEERTRAMGHPVGSIEATIDRLHTAGRIPIGGGRLSQSKSGQPMSLPMGDFKQCDGGAMGLRIHPGTYFAGSCDHLLLNRFTPLAVDRTLQEMLWLVHPDAVEGIDFHRDDLTWMWRVTTDQDLQIIEDNHKGVSSRAYEPGPYSRAEPGCERFIQWYLQQVG